ncbi:hypothetical protein FRC06_006901 [Ceratobasidium sp. 370]|nr:hypothetical protein FRC06_006901 [Ceratobasidium sp. 370]
MDTHGRFAVRYRNKYYRRCATRDGHPEGLGREFASQIPRDATSREEYVKADQLRHHEELANRPAGNRDFYAPDIIENTVWITGGSRNIRWTYLIDLDYLAFSVNGMVHFKLDNMPHDPTFDQYFGTGDCGEILYLPVPEEYLTTVSYWPDPTFDVQEASSAYDKLEPLIVNPDGWGAPSWDSLTVSQHLSVELVKTIVSDHRKTLAMAELMSEFGRVLLIGWQVACAAAPSHVLCPAEVAPSSQEARRAIVANAQRSGQPRILPYQINVKHVHDFPRSYCWFRGCLVKFCLRLDEDAWLKLEVTQMVEQLRKNGRVSGVGILISSFQLVAVAVDGSEVRRSPVMEFHNAKGDIRDGLLLLVHLLAPAATVHKISWRRGSPTVPRSISPILPEEVIQNILRFTDDDTYHFLLPLVSRLVRSMCLSRPRIGNFMLTRANTDGTYRVLSTQGPGAELRARLARKDKKVDPEFLHVFQHHQAGVGAQSEVFDRRMKARWKSRRYESTAMSWGSLMKGKDIPTMRVQVVDGVWGMIGVGDEGAGTT